MSCNHMEAANELAAISRGKRVVSLTVYISKVFNFLFQRSPLEETPCLAKPETGRDGVEINV